MANLIVMVDDELLTCARRRALERNTSVEALLREYLEALVGVRPDAAARRRFTAIARATSSSSEGHRTWSRRELHER